MIAPNGICNYAYYVVPFIQLPFVCYIENGDKNKLTYWRIYRGKNNQLFFNTQKYLLSMKYLIELIRENGWVSI